MSDAETVGVVEEPCWCTKCGYSMQHQPMSHEPHYGLLIAKCPECATVRPVHAAAISRTLAKGLGFARVSWFFFWCFAWVIGCAFAWATLAFVIGTEVSRPLRLQLRDQFGWDAITPEKVPAALASALPAHGITHALTRSEMLTMVLAVAFAFVSTALGIIGVPMLKLRGAMVLTLLAMIGAAFGTAFAIAMEGDILTTNAESLSWRYVGVWVAVLTIAACGVCAFAGLWVMRPAARWFLMLTGDPVMQLRATRLWTMDGKKPPQGMTRQS
ncbi:MAG TPA: hypothetical protein VK157_15950 [Phycisphaerales bacterium]|nr:hypothetical protein [Phycisphaerales bacterium]